jgi:photosystem II stability/assembly factor-like uncharacterized protein
MRTGINPLYKTILALVFFLQSQNGFGQNDPDMPNFPGNTMTKEEFMILRSEAIGVRRGIIKDTPFNPMDRIVAIRKMEEQERILALNHAPQVAWTEIGPNPIPNGQVQSGSQLPVSGRTISIAVHPTDANIVYVGTAQGGLYRTTDGGTTWTPMLDNALSLAIGSVAISPSQPETIYVGTGEPNFSSDSYFGVGIYRIDNASSGSPTITGPLGSSSFNGRAVSKIIVHPTDPATIFVSSTSGVGGIRSASTSPLPNVGVYRSTNATAASPTFTQIGVLGSPNNNINVRDIAIDPSNANILLANLVANGGGIYRSINALAATPTWTSIVTFSSTSTSGLTAEFAAIHPGADINATFYIATGNNTVVTNAGRVLKSTDGGASFSQINSVTFCSPQCFYNIAVAVDPTNVNNVYIGGTGANTFDRSTNGGTTFTPVQDNIHTDSHVIAVAPSAPATIYFGSDGGIYKSTNSGTTWTSLNNATFRATQFMSIAVHPTDLNYTIGGTQDNGTEYRNSAGTWTRSDFGDGGYAVIDQNAVNTTNVNMYHTYYNANTLTGYAYVGLSSATEGTWFYRGCNPPGNPSPTNGITCTATINFYAPLERGPGNPNSIYYGADRLYRSVDLGVNNATVSQTFASPISAIGIAASNDNVRIIGRNDGGLFGTTTGSAVLTDLDAGNAVPNSPIARTVVAPSDVNTAYVTLSAFNVVNVWKTTNLNNANPTWTAAAGSGGTALPLVPVNSIVVAPTNANKVFAGTDIGVYYSADGGATWNPFGTGLPRVAVFGMAITAGNVLRIATHGRGMWEITLSGVLSVKWLSVSGNLTNQKQAMIGWKVNETNVYSYEVQKSTDGRNFSSIGTVNSKGNGENSYEFTESASLQGTAFYRIKQVDIDGRPGFSSIIRLTTDSRANVTVYPNPAVDQMIVTVGRELRDTKMLLTDLAGKVLRSFTIQQLSFTFDLTPYPKGVYILKFDGGVSERIIKL